MSKYKRITVILLILDLPLIVVLFFLLWSNSETISSYPMSVVIQPFYNARCVLYAFCSTIVLLPTLIISYMIKKPVLSKLMFGIGFTIFIFTSFIAFNEIVYANKARTYFNPETVQSTMVEINLQQLEELQNNEETTMIYFGRPSCAHCSEIKPNLDILVNNSHSMVYYYNTEQDRDNNYNEMQALLDTYGVVTVPALVVLADESKTQEIYFDKDILDYFLDTSKFSY